MFWKTSAIVAGIVIGAAGSASAAPIGSATYQGAIFSIELLQDNGDGTYDFEYVANFTDFTGSAQYIIGINFKPGAGDLAGHSGESTDAAGSWTYAINDNLSSSPTGQECVDDQGGNGFFCGSLGSDEADWNQNPTTGTPNPTYTWLFTLDLGANGLDGSSLVHEAPIRALFATFNASSGRWQTSLASLTTGPDDDTPGGEDGGTIPEPATLALFGLGAALLGTRLRRK